MRSVRWFNSNVRALILSKSPVRGSKQEQADKEREALSCGGEFEFHWVKHVLKYHPFFWISWASSVTWLDWSGEDELCSRTALAWQCCVAAGTSRGQMRNSPSRVPCSGLRIPQFLSYCPWLSLCEKTGNAMHSETIVTTWFLYQHLDNSSLRENPLTFSPAATQAFVI